MKPTPDQAKQFALMLHVGLPPTEAVLYFLPPDDAADPAIVAATVRAWTTARDTLREQQRLQGGRWEDMSLDQRIQTSLDKHYAEKAYFLYSRHFAELSGQELTKAQEARKVLEAKLAGTSGKLDPLAQFWDDLKTGRVKLGSKPEPTTLPA